MNLDFILKRLIFGACCVFALTLPFDFDLSRIGLDLPLVKSFLLLEIVILGLLWEIAVIHERKIKIKTGGLLAPVFVFFLIHAYSAVFPSEKMIWSLKYTFRFFGTGLVSFVIMNFLTVQKKIDLILDFLFLGAGLAAGFVVIQYFFPFSLEGLQCFFKDGQVSPLRVRGLFGWPTVMAVYLGTFIPLIVSRLAIKPEAKIYSFRGIFYLALLLLLGVALFLSGTRGWIFGLFAGLFSFWVLRLINDREYRVFWSAIVILVIFALIYFGSGLFRGTMNNLEQSEASRLIFANEAVALIKAHPFKGIGADMFFWQAGRYFRAHNIFLEIWVNLGVFGLAVFIWLFFVIFKRLLKGLTSGISDKNMLLRLGIFSALASFLGHCQVDFFWQKQEIAGLFWVLVGVGLSLYLLREDEKNENTAGIN